LITMVSVVMLTTAPLTQMAQMGAHAHVAIKEIPV